MHSFLWPISTVFSNLLGSQSTDSRFIWKESNERSGVSITNVNEMPFFSAVAQSVWFMASLGPQSRINAHIATRSSAEILFSTWWCQLHRENIFQHWICAFELLSNYAHTDIKHT